MLELGVFGRYNITEQPRWLSARWWNKLDPILPAIKLLIYNPIIRKFVSVCICACVWWKRWWALKRAQDEGCHCVVLEKVSISIDKLMNTIFGRCRKIHAIYKLSWVEKRLDRTSWSFAIFVQVIEKSFKKQLKEAPFNVLYAALQLLIHFLRSFCSDAIVSSSLRHLFPLHSWRLLHHPHIRTDTQTLTYF